MSSSPSEHFVYHVTTVERAEQCMQEGILPRHTSLASENSVAIDARYDDARPTDVINRGISRANSVYAHPDIEHALRRRNGGWLNRSQEKLALLAIHIPNPNEVFVADGLLTVDRFTAQEYWASLTTLADYRSTDTPTFVALDPRCNNHPKRFVYMWPEVLIPGQVDPANISWDGKGYETEVA